MAVDRKSDHYTAAKNYTDLDGNTRSFDFVDHDIKAKISFLGNEELPKDWAKEYRKDLIKRTLDISASLCPEEFYDFTIRGEREKIIWNKVMLNDPGMSIDRLRSLVTLLENRLEEI